MTKKSLTSSILSKKIFIGGTGRSGTTILSEFLGNHRDIFKIPFESRFIVDRNGLLNLYDALTQNYSLDQGRVAIRDFEKKISHLIQPHKSPYLGLNLEDVIPPEVLQDELDRLLQLTSHGHYKGKDYHSKDKFNIIRGLRIMLKPLDYVLRGINKMVSGKSKSILPLYGYKGVYPKEEIFIPRYFQNKGDLSTIISNFTNVLFQKVANKYNKSHWCEDTPANAMHFDRLSDIFQDAFFIHIMRHPVGVAFSMNKQQWAPDTYEKICDLLNNLYMKLRAVHEYCSDQTQTNYKFVKLEELTSESELDNMVNFLGVQDDFTKKNIIKESEMNHYREKISTRNAKLIQKKLAHHMNYFGYQKILC